MSATNISGEAVKTVPEIISAASKSPLGVLSLMIIVLAVLAYVFFKSAKPQIRVGIFITLFTGTLLYGAAIVRETGNPTPKPPLEETSVSNNLIKGQVIDDRNFGVEAVSVTSTDARFPALTDSNGIFELVIHLGQGQDSSFLRFSKDGYEPTSMSVRPPISDGLQVALRKAPVAAVPKTCRLKSHGVELYRKSFKDSGQSGWMGGGHTQDEWCSNLGNKIAAQNPEAEITVLSKSEQKKDTCPPFNCPQYNYYCEVQVRTDPLYVEKPDSACN